MRAAYIPPKRSLDGAPERFEVGEERAMPMVYIPPKRSLDGAPASRYPLIARARRMGHPKSGFRWGEGGGAEAAYAAVGADYEGEG